MNLPGGFFIYVPRDWFTTIPIVLKCSSIQISGRSRTGKKLNNQGQNFLSSAILKNSLTFFEKLCNKRVMLRNLTITRKQNFPER